MTIFKDLLSQYFNIKNKLKFSKIFSINTIHNVSKLKKMYVKEDKVIINIIIGKHNISSLKQLQLNTIC